MNNENKFFIYARKSTDDLSRQMRSIDDQIAELRELAKREGLTIVETFTEKQTAKRPGRPIFNAMLDRLERGEAQGILAWHPDRLSRNSVDAGRIIWLVDSSVIKDLRFPTFKFDPSSSGKFMLGIMLGYSKYYSDNLSENIRRGQRQKLKHGIWPQFAPLGYLNDKATRTIILDPHRAPLVRKAFELYATSEYTTERLMQTVNTLGLTNRYGDPLSRNQYHRLLRNPLYYGLIRYKGEYYEGKHEPLITKAVFDAAQAAMKQKSKAKTPKLKPFLYRGIFRCGECGCFITTELQKGHHYLRCTKRVKRDCSNPYVREERIAEQVTEHVRSMSLNPEVADWMIAEIEAEQRQGDNIRQELSRNLAVQCREIDVKVERLTTAFLEQALTVDEFKRSKNQLLESKQVLKDQMTKLENSRRGWFEPAIKFISAAKYGHFLTKNGNDASRRDFLKKIGSNLTIRNRTLTIIPRKPWQLVAEQGVFAQREPRASASDARGVGEIHHVLNEAERGGFEPPRPFRADRFSKPAHSAALPPLREANGYVSDALKCVKFDWRVGGR